MRLSLPWTYKIRIVHARPRFFTLSVVCGVVSENDVSVKTMFSVKTLKSTQKSHVTDVIVTSYDIT